MAEPIEQVNIAVLGGGMTGLLSALFLARDGHNVTVYERDDTNVPATADEAFDQWQRSGVAHARQSHALLARLRSILGRRAPDVLEALAEQGATELSIERTLPAAIDDRTRRPGDEELALMCCRRLTLEWVLRRIVEAEPCVTWKGGADVRGLLATDSHVHGLQLADGDLASDLVVVAGGRHSPVLSWVSDLNGPVAPTEETHPSGIVYLSRFYRLNEGQEVPVLTEHGAGGDLGYVAFAGFYGDNNTFSITFGVPTVDRELLALLRDAEAWEAVIRQLVPLQPWTADGLASPITDVEVQARLENRIRRFVVDGTPAMTGAVVIGDAALSTNPWYGKGCSMAGIWAESLSAALAEHGRDHAAVALALDQAMTEHLEPHYRQSCRQDGDRMKLHSAMRSGDQPDEAASKAREFVHHGLLPAVRSDPDIYRKFFRSFNMLDHPEQLMKDEAVMNASLEALMTMDQRPPLPKLGPDRDELFSLLT